MVWCQSKGDNEGGNHQIAAIWKFYENIFFQLAAQPRKDEDNKGHTRTSDF